jgi:hypothetical protein
MAVDNRAKWLQSRWAARRSEEGRCRWMSLRSCVLLLLSLLSLFTRRRSPCFSSRSPPIQVSGDKSSTTMKRGKATKRQEGRGESARATARAKSASSHSRLEPQHASAATRSRRMERQVNLKTRAMKWKNLSRQEIERARASCADLDSFLLAVQTRSSPPLLSLPSAAPASAAATQSLPHPRSIQATCLL